jgi:hypothetical protein
VLIGGGDVFLADSLSVPEFPLRMVLMISLAFKVMRSLGVR